MKFAVLVNEGPYAHQASDSAYYFTQAALSQGHEVMRVFFYHDGVTIWIWWCVWLLPSDVELLTRMSRSGTVKMQIILRKVSGYLALGNLLKLEFRPIVWFRSVINVIFKVISNV